MKTLLTQTGCALILFLCSIPPADAQIFWGSEYERSIRPGVNTPYDGMPYTQRYNYDPGPFIFYPGLDARNLMYVEYLDRLERAEKFGYRKPREPFTVPEPKCHGRFGFGMGWYGGR